MRYSRMYQPDPYRTVMRTTCDVCGEEIKDRGPYENSEATIKAEIGDIFPEGDCRTVHEIDCCPQCFLERVKPVLERVLVVKFRERDAEDFKSEKYAVPEDE